MKNELIGMRVFPHKAPNYNRIEKFAEEALNDINPVLVGKNVVFSKKWLNFIGKGKPFTEQKFRRWRDRTDIVYDKYAELIGSGPRYGQKIYIDAQDGEGVKKGLGHAHTGYNVVCIDTAVPGFQREITVYGTWGQVLLHEMGHVFANGRKWESEPETITNLLLAYALENTPEMKIGVNPTMTGKQLRMKNFNDAEKITFQRK